MGGARAVGQDEIARRIFAVRAQRVMLDFDLADLYGVPTKALLQAVRRNPLRFPPDFMFRLTRQDLANLKSQSVTSSSWGGRRKPVTAFTEQGVAMLSSVLRSPRAVAANVAIMRAVVQLRYLASANSEIARKLDELERRVAGHDEAITTIIRAIRDLAAPPAPQKKTRIGFITQD
jgi:ATP-dependent Clp protease ATP-binding subunit ClpA